MTEHLNLLSIARKAPITALLAAGLLFAACGDGEADSPAPAENADAPGENSDAAGAPAENNGEEAAENVDSGAPTGDMALGDVNAPVTIIEYASMTCSHCAAFHSVTYPPLKKDYVDTGKVRFIFREFPLDNFAYRASILARCAGEDQYFDIVGKLFETQNDWLPSNQAQVDSFQSTMAGYGKEFGVSADKYQACIDDKKLEARVLARIAEARNRYGVASTPSLVINGELYEGSRAYGEIARHIDGLMPAE